MGNFIRVQLIDGKDAIISKLNITKIVTNSKGNVVILFNGMGANNFPQSIEVRYTIDYLLKILNE